MMKRFLGWTLFCALFLSFPCSLQAKSYSSELDRVTEKSRKYNFTTWDAKLIWHATLFTDRFRVAQAKKHVELNKLGPIPASRWFASEAREQAEHWEFFISLYTKKDYKKFSLDDDSFWHVRLVTETGEEVKPTSIELLPDSVYLHILYPHLNRWAKGYRVLFPKVDLGKKPKLMLWSVVGESTLKWSLRGSKE